MKEFVDGLLGARCSSNPSRFTLSYADLAVYHFRQNQASGASATFDKMLTCLATVAILIVLSFTSEAAAQSYTGGDLSGCGKTHFFNGITQPRIIKSGSDTRTYGVHLPSNYSPTKQYPLIVGFHGSSSIGLFFEADTRLDEAKYTGDKIMIYPNGLGRAWAGASYSKSTVSQDLQFVHDILAHARSEFCVDSARIYATGMSIGGGFVNTIACNDTVGGEFAAFAIASGSFYTDAHGPGGCTPARDVTPILEFHGGADKDVLYSGGAGQGGYEPPIADW